ncbi:hypothetical protein [Pseudooctadecabacter sp.]|uniref:hypothetical protein n=1 Tax=Pseudooctadecabacter sp. TaxID=1966338 RepID=UPI0025D2ECAC|nr:hypothetical protein [Pseudooctadecabacter sp.]
MIRFACVFALMAAPVVAQTEDEVAAMTRAVEEAGCVVTADNGDAVQAASGLDADQTMAVIAQMYNDGLVALQADGTMKLTNEVCG